MYVNEVFRGRYVKGAQPITEFPNAEHLNELMIVGPITVRSACSHHFCPVIGKIWIGVLPNEHTNVIGLSKYARWPNGSWAARRSRKRPWCNWPT
jgi:GTP cyclohydrolase I